MNRDLAWQSAHRLAELVRTREVSASEVVAATFNRIEDTEGTLHAFLTLDREGASARAAEIDRELAAGAKPGPLSGVPFSVKDQIWTKGVRTTAGSLQLASHVPSTDAACVRRLKDAGALMIGKTNTPEYGLSWRTHNKLGPETVNPWDLTRTSGGSSGGAAASLAAGITPIAIGADGAGSIRLPAAFCGVVGLHVSLGRVPRYGVFDGGFHVSGIGPMTRDIRDAAIVYELISGPDGHDPTCIRGGNGDAVEGLEAGLDGVSFVWWASDAASETRDERVMASSKTAADRLAGPGLAESTLELDLERYRDVLATISSVDRYARLGQQRGSFDDPAARSLLGSEARQRFAEGKAATGAEFTRAMSARAQARARLDDALEEYTLILAPVTPFVAPLVPSAGGKEPRTPVNTFTYMANLTGLPAISVPCGAVDGLPVGLQIIGRFGDEPTVLRAARALEALYPWTDRRPPLAQSHGLTTAEA